jgi:Ca-activated chloride channel homolog
VSLQSLKSIVEGPLKRRVTGFALAGFVGGSVGSLVAESVVRQEATSYGGMLLNVAGWSSAIGLALSLALTWASERHRRQESIDRGLLLRAGAWGGFGGAGGGMIAQIAYSLMGPRETLVNEILIRPIAWSIMGLAIGIGVSLAIPNLSRRHGALGGAIGGVVGSWGFSIVAFVAATLFGRLIGSGTLGAAIGLAILAVENLTRAGYLEITWAPNEVTTVSLGGTPVTLGGGPEDHIFVNGLAPAAGRVVLRSDQVIFTDGPTGRETPLRDGSRIKIGAIDIRVVTTRS